MSLSAENLEASRPSTSRVEAPKLDRTTIAAIVASGKRLLVQGGMGIHASDGLAGKVAAHPRRAASSASAPSRRWSRPPSTCAPRSSAPRPIAPGGFVGVNLMAAINKADFELLGPHRPRRGGLLHRPGRRHLARHHPLVPRGRHARSPASSPPAGSPPCTRSGAPSAWSPRAPRPAATSATSTTPSPPWSRRSAPPPRCRWSRPAASTPPTWGATSPQGAAGVQLATRFIASSDGDAHPTFKQVHLGKKDEDVTIITSCVKGMKARAVRNAFTEALAAGKTFPPRSKAWYFGPYGYMGRKKACIECLAEEPLQVPGEQLPGELLHHRRAAPRRGPGRRGARPLLHRPEPGAPARDRRSASSSRCRPSSTTWTRRSTPSTAPGRPPRPPPGPQ